MSESSEREAGLAAGLVGMTPLLLAYEVAQRSGLSWRNSSERLAPRQESARSTSAYPSFRRVSHPLAGKPLERFPT